MQLTKAALDKIVHRPFILIVIAILVLFYCVIDFFNPLIAVIFGFSAIGEGDTLGTILSLLKIILSPALLWKAGLWIAAGVGILSFIGAFLLSGFFYMLHNALEDYEQQRGEFFQGIKIYFWRMLFINVRFLLLTVFFMLFICIVSIPALFVTWSWATGKTELFLMMCLLNAITIGVAFFACMFFRIYTFYGYPALFYFEARVFVHAKRRVDASFFSIMGRWVLFDIIFVLFESLFLYIKYLITLSNADVAYSIALSAGKWVYLTLFTLSLFTFIFASFKNLIYKETA